MYLVKKIDADVDNLQYSIFFEGNFIGSKTILKEDWDNEILLLAHRLGNVTVLELDV